jgi:hypothetical protein
MNPFRILAEFVCVSLILYTLGAFISMELNVTKWHEVWRASLVALAIWITCVAEAFRRIK